MWVGKWVGTFRTPQGVSQGTPQGVIVLINAHVILLRRKGSDREDSENVAILIH